MEITLLFDGNDESDVDKFKCSIKSQDLRSALCNIKSELRSMYKHMEYDHIETQELVQDIYSKICDEIYLNGIQDLIDG
jgi:hypothetical protein